LSRLTISLDGQIEDKLKEIQNQLNIMTEDAWSLSKIVNMVLLGGIFGSTSMKICDWHSIKRFMDKEEKNLFVMPVEYVAYFAALEQVV